MVRKLMVLTAAVLLFWVSPASAQYGGNLNISDPEPTQGQTVTVTGDSCPGMLVSIYIVQGVVNADDPNAISADVLLGTVQAGPDGTYSLDVTIPEGFETGDTTLVASCGDHLETTTFVLGESITNTTDPGGNNNNTTTTGPDSGVKDKNENNGGGGGKVLPRTGSNLNGIGIVGAALLCGGGIVLLAARRRVIED